MKPAALKKWLRMAGMLAALAISTASHADKIYFVHNDHLGTPQVITDENKNVVWEVDRDPWGNITNVLVNNLPNNVSLPGQYDDAETNYSDNWHRTYDKQLGQYLQFDPIGLAGGMNPYLYANANPVMFIDPMGLYVPTRLPENCWLVIIDTGSYTENDIEYGAAYIYDTAFIPLVPRRLKNLRDFTGINGILIEYWRQTNTLISRLTEWMQYFVRCEKKGECGKAYYEDSGHNSHSDVNEQRTIETLEWIEVESIW